MPGRSRNNIVNYNCQCIKIFDRSGITTTSRFNLRKKLTRRAENGRFETKGMNEKINPRLSAGKDRQDFTTAKIFQRRRSTVAAIELG